MKKKVFPVICLLTAILLLGTANASSSNHGLEAFEDIRIYREDLFSDVSASSWFASGVRIAYSKGIMDGKGTGEFDPDATVTWAEAVTIAARLHAAYYGANIPEIDGIWYLRYLDYAQGANLLPATCPETNLDEKRITRQELAGLYRSVLSDKDIPVINDGEIIDIDNISADFTDAVRELYAAGIFTGKETGFDPQGLTSRAEIATIISRLLCPALRVSHDSRQPRFLTEQLGNFFNGGVAVEAGDVTYYIYKNELESRGNGNQREFEIIARNNDGAMRTVYCSERQLAYLSGADDGTLYFLERISIKRGDHYEWSDTIRHLDPSTGEVSDFYVCKLPIDAYLFYDGQLYVAQTYPTRTSDGAQLLRVENGKETVLASTSDALRVDQSLYAFNGKLYFFTGEDILKEGDVGKYDTYLWSVDLETGELKRITRTPYSSSTIGYCSGTAWIQVYGESSDAQGNIYRFNLEMPHIVEKVLGLEGDMNTSYANLYANDGHVYFHSTGAGNIWEITPDGSATKINKVSRPFNSSLAGTAVLDQCILYLPLGNGVSSLIMEQIDVVLPDGKRINYAQFMEKPNYVMASKREEAAGNMITYDAAPAADIHADCTAVYYTASGDLAVEYTITNGTSKKESLYALNAVLTVGQRDIQRCFKLSGDVAAGGSRVCTTIYPAGFLQLDAPLEGVTVTADVQCLK